MSPTGIEWTEETWPLYNTDMAQTREGAIKVAAKRIGISTEEYRAHIYAGQKFCITCRYWHPRNEFSMDASRSDGLHPSCRASRNRRARQQYEPRDRDLGKLIIPARDGDKRQARRRVNYFVEAGLIPHPNEIPCTDCNATWTEGQSRHEYDHHLGYAAEHHEHVDAVCAPCHHKRDTV